MKEQVEILLKEYDLMRKEIHLYISKYYVALTVIPGILFASAFKVDDNKYSIASVFVPYVIAAMFGYMAMISFFINKIVGYIRIIENRINDIYKDDFPLLLWETKYADIGIERDSNGQYTGLLAVRIIALLIPLSVMLIIIMAHGWTEVGNWELDVEMREWKGYNSICLQILYLSTSIVSLIFAVTIYCSTATTVRRLTNIINLDIFIKIQGNKSK